MSRNLPNFLTFFRLLLVPFIVRGIWTRQYGLALLLVFVASVTDGIDGYLARHFAWTSRLGSYLDPIADKLLLVLLYIMLGITGVVPIWLMWLVLGRDLLILLMVAFAYIFTRVRSFPPSLWGKISTIIQMGAAVALLGGKAFDMRLDETWFYPFAVFTTAAVTVWSGVHYAWRGLRELRRTLLVDAGH